MKKLSFHHQETSGLGIPDMRLTPKICQACGKPLLPIPDTVGFSRGFSAFCPECKAKRLNVSLPLTAQEEMTQTAQRRKDYTISTGWYPPPRFYGATLENFNAKLQPKAYALIKSLLAQPERGMLLWGPPGVGKTHLAAAVFNHFEGEWDAAASVYPRARFVREHDLFARIRATFGKSPPGTESQTEEEIIAEYVAPPILILDDLCKYAPADPSFRNRIYYELFDRLWNQKAIVVLTANISPTELEGELGSPIVDRIRDLCVVCEMKGASQRGKL